MAATHFEPFVHLVDVLPDRALIGWGGFWFERDRPEGRWEIVDDERLPEVAGRGSGGSIGANSQPYGSAVVEVYAEDGSRVASVPVEERNWAWVGGLRPDTPYRYRILLDGEEWAAGKRWDWAPSERGGYDLVAAGRSYDLRFRTHPAPDERQPLDFAVLGDFGVGIRADSEQSHRQRRVAQVLDRLVADGRARLVLTVGDNVYVGEQGRADDESGGEDDDWYSSFYQPYRYVLARVPVYPAIGNHDTSDTESADDRSQVADNFHLHERFAAQPGERRASVEPGLFYSFRFGADVEFVCLDTSEASDLPVDHFFEDPGHRPFLDAAFPPAAAAAASPPRWRVPFSHHPTYCAGPKHPNTEAMLRTLVPLFHRSGVRAAFAGHEHNFQLSRADGITYVLTGAGGRLREDPPQDFAAARTVAWAAQAHLLRVELSGERMAVTPYACLGPDGRPLPMTALDPDNRILEPPFRV